MDDFREFEIRQKDQLRRRAKTIPSWHPEADDPPDEPVEDWSDYNEEE